MGDRVSIADVRVDRDACSACLAYVQFGPTDALAASGESGRFTLPFLAAACGDCGICAVAYPESAVRFRTHPALSTRESSLRTL